MIKNDVEASANIIKNQRHQRAILKNSTLIGMILYDKE